MQPPAGPACLSEAGRMGIDRIVNACFTSETVSRRILHNFELPFSFLAACVLRFGPLLPIFLAILVIYYI